MQTHEILEYCKPEDVIKVEQKYINLLEPEYNLLQVAGGYKHTEETIAKLIGEKVKGAGAPS